MDYRDTPAWRAQVRKQMRPNAHLDIRHDAFRFMPPGAPRYVGKDVVKYLWPHEPAPGRPASAPDAIDSEARRLAAERDELLRLRAELDAIKAEFELRRLLRERKTYDPNQPRVPAGSSEGGQWTDREGGASGNGAQQTRLADAGTHSDRRVLSDATPDGLFKPGVRVAQADTQKRYSVDLNEEEARAGGIRFERM